jgi:protein-tyrosine kinase
MVERLKQALDQARADREALARVSTTPGARLPKPLAGMEGPRDTTGHLLRSRVMAVDADHLRRERILMPGLTTSIVAGGLAAVQGYKMLRTQVLQRMAANGWNTLAIMSPTPGDGKTLTAINLAIAISADVGHSALLVDFDLRRPTVAARLGIAPDQFVGVESSLAGKTPIAEAFLRLEGYERLMLLGAAAVVPASSELLASARTREIVRDLKSRYADRIVIFDLPPVLGGDDAVAFAPQVDAVLLVIGEGHTRVDDVLRTFELLRDKPVIGTVLNHSRTDTTGAYAY